MAIDTGKPPIAPERRLYTAAAVLVALVAFAGFARSYYLKGAFGTPELPALVHVHAVVMTLWIATFIAQARLVAARRVDLHRRLGLFGAALAGTVLVVGAATAIEAARRGVSPGPPPLVFLAIPLAELVLFALFVGTALWMRRRSDVHKRLMLLATLSILTPAIARLPIDALHSAGLPAFFAVTDVIVLACVAWDTARNRRLHPAFGWGVPLLLLSQPARVLLAGSPAWMAFAQWLVS